MIHMDKIDYDYLTVISSIWFTFVSVLIMASLAIGISLLDAAGLSNPFTYERMIIYFISCWIVTDIMSFVVLYRYQSKPYTRDVLVSPDEYFAEQEYEYKIPAGDSDDD